MSIKKIYSVYDRKAQYYLPLYIADSDAQAERQFSNVVVTSETDISKYPADFDLVCVGTMNMENAEILPKRPVDLIINGLVALQAANFQRSRYQKVLSDQMDIEEFAQSSDAP